MLIRTVYTKGKNGNWNALQTSDLKLDAKEAFRLYSRRWVIEVAHKEMKQNLKLGKNQCRDFAGQIAGVSLCVLQYNILSYVKRNESYETIGGLFAGSCRIINRQPSTLELFSDNSP